MDYSKITLGELLSHVNETIRRNAMSILKQLQRQKIRCNNCYFYFTDEGQLKMKSEGAEYYNVCPKCDTDEFLTDIN